MKKILLVILACTIMGTGSAHAQSLDQQGINNRLDRLERDIQTLQVELFRERPVQMEKIEGDLPDDAAARLSVKINNLEVEIRDLTGRVEKVSFELNSVKSRMDQLISDVDRRLLVLESTRAPMTQQQQPAHTPAPQQKTEAVAPVKTQPEKVADDAPVPSDEELYKKSEAQNSLGVVSTDGNPNSLPEGTPGQKYDYAFGLLQKSEFEEAEKALKAFLNEYYDHALAGNAQYWLSESYYVRQDYSNAAVNFLKGYQDFPDSSKAPDNLLKLALSLSQLGSKQEACTTLGKLAQEYPNASASIKRRGAAEWERLNCS